MPTVEEYLTWDPRNPAALSERSLVDIPPGVSPKDIYLSRRIHQLEVEHVWKKTWQVACRETDVAKAGDFMVYDVADQSVIITRTEAGALRAYHNVCLHRGTPLVEGSGSTPRFRCTFHAWTWDLDGNLAELPCRWDFPHVDRRNYALREVQVDTWNGFVFVNLDPHARSLAEYLGPTVLRHFELWPRADSVRVAWVRKRMPVNWKIAMEVFLEGYHVFRVHPQMVEYSGDANTQYDAYGLHSRFIAAMGVPSPHLDHATDEQAIVDAMIGEEFANMFGDTGAVEIPQVPDGATARTVIAQFMREVLGTETGADFSAKSDADMLDAIQYFLFSNFMPWAGYQLPMNYSVRPDGDDPESCIFDLQVLMSAPSSGERPPDAALHVLTDDEPWSAAAELGGLGPVFDQDMVNIYKIQRGLHSDGLDGLTFAEYHEMNIRNFHRNLRRCLDEGKVPPAEETA
jgi:phenylpropionate dioxygenase-like ring-hydroxylating dioxygenase large terminal subunit